MQFCEADAPYLRLHLPVLVDSFDTIIPVTYEPDGEAADIVASHDLEFLVRPFAWNWSDYWNNIIDYATGLGHKAMIRLDPDELIFPTLVDRLDNMLDRWRLIGLPRYNFFYDRTQYNVDSYPDLQWRCFRLDGTSRYDGKAIHEGIQYTGPLDEYVYLASDNMGHIYHYGDIGPNIQRRALRYHNLGLVDQGLPPVSELPADIKSGAMTQTFVGAQPLETDPFAPFEDVKVGESNENSDANPK